MKPTKEQLLKQLENLTALAKSKGLIKVDPVTKLPGTFVDKSEGSIEKQGSSIQSGISQAAAAGGVPHTTPAGSTMGAIHAMGSAFGKSGNLDKHVAKDLADKCRAIYGKASNQEASISANNVPEVNKAYEGFKSVESSARASGAKDPAAVAAAVGRKKYGKEAFQHAAAAGKKMGKSELKAELEKADLVLKSTFDRQSNGDAGKDSSAERSPLESSKILHPVTKKDDDAPPGHPFEFKGKIDRSGDKHIASYRCGPGAGSCPHDTHEEAEKWLDAQKDRIKGVKKTEALGKPVPKGVSPTKYDNCVEDVKRKGGKAKNPYAVCAASLKKDDEEIGKALAASQGKAEFNKCDKLKGIIGSLKKGFFLP